MACSGVRSSVWGEQLGPSRHFTARPQLQGLHRPLSRSHSSCACSHVPPPLGSCLVTRDNKTRFSQDERDLQVGAVLKFCRVAVSFPHSPLFVSHNINILPNKNTTGTRGHYLA